MKKILVLLVFLLIILPIPLVAAYEYHGPEIELILLINNERLANNAPALTINWEVTRLARYKTEEMKVHRFFDHESLVYGNPAETLARFHIPHTVVSANIAKGYETAQDVITAWINAPGHHANLINPEFTSAGVGLSLDDNGIPYWTLILLAE